MKFLPDSLGLKFRKTLRHGQNGMRCLHLPPGQPDSLVFKVSQHSPSRAECIAMHKKNQSASRTYRKSWGHPSGVSRRIEVRFLSSFNIIRCFGPLFGGSSCGRAPRPTCRSARHRFLVEGFPNPTFAFASGICKLRDHERVTYNLLVENPSSK